MNKITFAVGYRMGSGAIRAAGYDVLNKRLGVVFADGNAYVYEGIPKKLWDAFRGAQSFGAFFQHHIREKYQSRAVELSFKTMRHIDGSPVIELTPEDFQLSVEALSEAWF